MKLVVFGLSISSSWGNGHATVWRSLEAGLAEQGHTLVFFERDVEYYAAHRDLHDIQGGQLCLYTDWTETAPLVQRHLSDADAALVTSFCPDAQQATRAVRAASVPVRAFYDLDTPVTLSRLSVGERVPWVGPEGMAGFDVVLSFTGGRSLEALCDRLGARRAVALYGSVDPGGYRPVPVVPAYEAELSYLGTYARDRQRALEELFIEPAARCREQRFLIGGSMYPPDFPWRPNVRYVRHVPPARHPAFYCSSKLTLNVTRGAMAAMGHCPSGRLFEAAACGVPVLSDSWPGLEHFFEPGEEILVARSADEAVCHLKRPAAELESIGRAARARALEEHSGAARARRLVDILDGVRGRPARGGRAGRS